ncbi:RNA polymerase sigma factor [Chitinophaga silvatica]|nr:sigma-70 family RNA polymerase sigma factor [Chitinophaga silvatica]
MSQTAFEAAVALHWNKLLGIAAAKTNSHDAFDIVQDVFLSLWERWELVPKDEELEYYLLNALKFRVYNYYRTTGRYTAHLKNLEIILNETLETADALAQEELHGLKETLVNEALDTLSDSQRQLFILRVKHHYSYQQIAQLLNIDAASARVLYSRALKQVKMHIQTNPSLSVSLLSSMLLFTIR